MIAKFEDIDVSALSLDELQALVEAARREITHKEQTKLFDVRNQIESLASSVGRSVEELMNLDARRKRAAAKPAATERVVKYRNTTDASQTWSGRGKRPRWLQEALDSGAKLENFLVA
ncbi:nucleoid protein H-NS [Plasticicumulans lactativorans]|uniref:Nucleoid protein H-NS n=1 Tax=Plasticicumulans lactativorans TaxID=1133106 RepID=A0A4R2KPB9_9GAMM|nr:H-NS histone family protein [Plasticicumulans lactativorans]TCO75563.1 nucleoid protein H-NS [Plasticicumulans lactativorans]